MIFFKPLQAVVFILGVTHFTGTAQVYPGGVSGNITLWLKANATTGNITYNGANQVSQWKDELSTYATTQGTTSKQPVLVTTPNTITNFNFNPSLQFDVATQRALANTNATPDLLSSTGTAFIVINTYIPSGSSSSSCFAYMSNTNYRYQMKANFRIQTGNNGTGYTADLNLGPATIYPDIAGRILVSRATGSAFYARRNAQIFPINNTATLYNPAIGTGLCVGANTNTGGSEYSNSAIAEIITYNSTLSLADINQVESYLAVKYGATLDQTVTTNYVSSTAAITWNATANAGYNNNITGIGRDDNSGLLQKQSKSVNYDGYIYMYNDNPAGTFPAMNSDNTTTISANDNFLIFGDNAADTSLSACYNDGHRQRMGRIWKVQKTGTSIGATTLAYNTGVFNNNIQYLLVSQNAAFPSNATTVYPLTTGGGKKYANLTLNNNDFFTFATDSLVLALADTAICPGNSVTLTTTANGSVPTGTFTWNVLPGGSPLSTLSCTNCLNPTASPTVNTSYTTIYHYGSCNYNDTVTVSMLPAPVFSVGPDTTTCIKDSLQLHIAFQTNPTGTYHIQWLPSTYLSNDTVQSPYTKPLQTITYTITVSDSNTCIATDTIGIKVLQGFTLFNGDTTICRGQSVQILSAGETEYNYTWTPGITNGVSDATIIDPTITPDSSRTYTVTASYPGCTDSSAALKITLQEIPIVFAGNDTGLCLGNKVFLNGNVLPANQTYVYSWTPAVTLDDPAILNPLFSGFTTTTLTLTANTSAGCTSTDDVVITVTPSKFLEVSADASICPGDTAQLHVEGASIANFRWKNSTYISDTTSTAPFAFPPVTETFTVYGTSTSLCTDTASVTVIVQPGAVVNLPDSVTLYPGNVYQLEPITNGLYFSWFPFGGLSSTIIANPIASPNVNTRYKIIATTEYGCKAEDSIDVFIAPDSYIDIANAFSPANETLKVLHLGDASLKSFTIYNRWGNKVFATNNLNDGWDGTYKGAPEPGGVYIYIVEAVSAKGKPFYKQGNITLIR